MLYGKTGMLMFSLLIVLVFSPGGNLSIAETNGLNPAKMLAQLRAFEFSLDYQSDMPISLRGRFSGTWEGPDKESWRGYWERDGGKVRVELYARGDEQMEKEGAGWRKSPRGVETRVLEQIQQVVYNASFEFIGERSGRFLYQFRPNLPLVDPLGVKNLTGTVEIDKKSGLPLRIYCQEEGGSTRWEMRFYNFNRAKRIKIPFVPAVMVQLVNTGKRRVGCCGWKRAMTVLRSRLRRYGVDFRIKRGRNGIEVELSEKLAPRNLELLFSAGKVELWAGKWKKGDSVPGEKVFFVQGDVARAIVLNMLVAGNRQLTVEPVLDLPVEPRLRVRFPSIQGDAHGLIALVVNDVVLDVAPTVNGGECVFTNIGSDEFIRVVSVLAGEEPLPVSLKVNIVSQ